MNKSKSKSTLRNRFGAMLIALAILITMGFVSVIGAVNDAHAANIGVDAGTIPYTSTYSSRADLREAGLDTNREVMGEGAVLLKKADGLTGAPLKATGNKVTVLSKNSVNPVYSGTGSSGGTSSPVDFYKGLTYGGLIEYNPDAYKLYKDNSLSGTGRPAHSGMSGNFAGFPVGEMRATGAVNYGGTAWNGTSEAPEADVKYDPKKTDAGYSNYQSIRKSYETYDDAAILMFSRFGGEGYDMPRSAKMINCTSSTYPAGTGTGSFNVSAGNWGTDNANLVNIIPGAHSKDSHYMAIDLNEENAIKEASEYFDNVIVIINSASPIELGLLEKYPKVTAYWIGTPGENGFEALPGLLTGATNPSGGLVDTYHRDFLKDPAILNFSNNGVDYGHYYYVDGKRQSIPFVEYQEGIYLGYRYYETRYAEMAKTSVTDADKWYKDNVVYPFGYGLSYTTFTKEIVGRKLDGVDFTDAATINPTSKSKFTVSVKVKNTGTVAGKEIVQIYSGAPYTAGGIEKAAKTLVGYGKTSLLAAGAEETISIEVDAYHMASYDYDDANKNEFKGYELESGAYKLYVARHAHDSALAVNFTIGTGLKIDKDPTTETKVENIYDETSNHMKTNSVILSRESGFSNLKDLSNGSTRRNVTKAFMDKFSTTSYSYSEANIKSMFEQTNIDLTGNVVGHPTAKYTDAYPHKQAKLAAGAAVPKAGGNNISPEVKLTYEETTLKFRDMYGVDYNDAKWDTFMNQLTYQQMYNVMTGNYYSVGIDCIGKPFIPDLDGPVGFTGGSTRNGQSEPCLKIVSTCVIAATFNKELANDVGEIVGNEGLWGYDTLSGGGAVIAALNAQGNANANSGTSTSASSGTKIGGWYAPATNTHRTPFSGRNFEYFSEDGFLAGNTMGSLVVGAQKFGVYSFIKHFFLNDQETDRGTSGGLATWVDEQAAREIYAKSFEISVKMSVAYAKSAGRQPLMAVMTAFNRIGHRGAFMDSSTLQTLLRGEWGFVGQVITDYGAGVQNKNLIAGNDKFLSNVTWNATVVDTLNDTTKIAGQTAETATYGNAYRWALRTAAKNILYTGANSSAVMSTLLPVAQNISIANDAHCKSGEGVLFEVGKASSFNLATDIADAYKPRVNYGDRSVVQYTYAVAPDSALPDGLTLSSAGVISGTPTKATISANGTITAVPVIILVSAVGNTNGTAGDTITYTTVRQQVSIQVGTDLNYSDAHLGLAEFDVAFSVNAGTAAMSAPKKVAEDYKITYVLAKGSVLPSGLSLNAETGVISGTVRSRNVSAPYSALIRILAVAENETTGDIYKTEAHFTLSVGASVGLPGKDGADGADGVDGANGKDGVDGTNGTNGTDGKDGTNGKDGVDGKDGKDGADATGGCGGTVGIVGGVIAMGVILCGAAVLLVVRKRKDSK